MKQTIRSLTGPDSITLFWDLPENAPAEYEIFLDGISCGTTAKTHFTLSGLEPATAYRVEVRPGGVVRTMTETPKRRLDVTAAPYYAVGDGAVDNTAALQKALDDCGPAEMVYFPSGVYCTGALYGHSDLELYLAEGAVLQGSDRPEAYLPRLHSRFEGTEMECYASLLNFGTLDHTAGPNCENIRIWGKGTIRGGGKALAWSTIESERERRREELAAMGDLIKECENENTIPGRVRGRLINLSNCCNVRISGLTLADGPSWNVHMVYSRNVVTDHCIFRSKGIWNGDGWDPDSSEDCTLFGCQFYTGDDAVAIKSGKNPEGNQINRPTRRVRVFDCYSAFGHGICIGSEISGGIEDVRIWDCDLTNSQVGVMVKGTKKRGGYVRDLTVRRCVLPRVMMCAVGYNDDGIAGPHPPEFSDCRFEELTLTGQYQDADGDGSMKSCAPVELAGFDVPGYELKDVRLCDITLTGSGAQSLLLAHCSGVCIENIQCRIKT